MLRLTAPLALLLCLAGCSPEPDPQALIARAQQAHGVEALDATEARFVFRGRTYAAERAGGRYRYSRTFADSTGAQVEEVLTNDDLYRTVDGRRVQVPEDTLRAIETAINSVVYFAFLPAKLDDPAVQTQYLGETFVEGEPYHEVEVTFAEEGGGRDHEDRFIYWLHRDRGTMDYLAYYYYTGDGGSRFRKATNVRTVDGLRVADYLNLSVDTMTAASIDRYDEIDPAAMDTVSVIALTDLELRPLDR